MIASDTIKNIPNAINQIRNYSGEKHERYKRKYKNVKQLIKDAKQLKKQFLNFNHIIALFDPVSGLVDFDYSQSWMLHFGYSALIAGYFHSDFALNFGFPALKP